MNIYDALNLAEMNGHRASLQSDGRWFLIRKSDRAIVNIGYSIIEAVSVLVEAEPEVAEVEAEVESEEVVEQVAEVEAEVVAEPVAEVVETANLTNFDIVTLAECNGFRVSLQETGEWLLIRKSDRKTTNVGYDLRDALAIINPAPETFAQIEIERGYAAQEAEEHAAWVAEQHEEVNVVSDSDYMTDINTLVRRFEVAVIAEEIRNYTGANRYPYATPITDRDVEIFLGIECDGDETIDEIIRKWQGPSRYTGNDYWEAYDRYVDEHPEVAND